MTNDDQNIYCVMDISDTQVNLSFKHKDTVNFFGNWIKLVDFPSASEEYTVIPQAEWSLWLESGGSDDGYGEYTCSTACVSDVLLKADRCIIHAVAFRYRQNAWLIAGPSGVGKTTQVKNLQKMQQDAIKIICGDRPVLKLTDNDKVFVYPSPWNGKENWRGGDEAVLTGIILLERGKQNSIKEINVQEAIIPLLSVLIHTGETEDNIRNLAHFADRFLKHTRAFKMVSHQVPDSTELLFNTIYNRCS